MKTNKETRKTMPQEWVNAFEICRKRKYGKYFKDDDFRTCAYNSEIDDNEIVECAPRRQHGNPIYLLDYARQDAFEQIFKYRDVRVNQFFVTTSYRYGGVWVYDEKILAHTPIKPRNGHPYYRININECYKICDLWDVLDKSKSLCTDAEIYHIARNQYEHMINKNKYDKVQTWEDLPDYILWKYLLPGNKIIEGREQMFKDYIARAKAYDGYIAPIDLACKEMTNSSY